MNKPTIGHYASHQRDVTAQEDAALNAALRSSTIKVEHPEIARLRDELAEYRQDAERYRWLREKIENDDFVIARVSDWGFTSWSGDDPDRYIDAALEAKGEK